MLIIELTNFSLPKTSSIIATNAVDVLVPNLHEDEPALRQQIPRNRQPVPQIRQIRMNPIPPRIPKRLDLLRLAGDVVSLAVLHVAAGRGPLEVGVELDAVGRVEVDALDFAAQTLAFGERCHHLQAIAEDHAVCPVGVVLVELGRARLVGQAVEVSEQIKLLIFSLIFGLLRLPRRSSMSTLGWTFSWM